MLREVEHLSYEGDHGDHRTAGGHREEPPASGAHGPAANISRGAEGRGLARESSGSALVRPKGARFDREDACDECGGCTCTVRARAGWRYWMRALSESSKRRLNRERRAARRVHGAAGGRTYCAGSARKENVANVDLLAGVQQKLRARSGGKFYREPIFRASRHGFHLDGRAGQPGLVRHGGLGS